MYDPATAQWVAKKKIPMPIGIFGISMVDRKIYIIGGFNQREKFSTVGIYDPNTNTWAIGKAPRIPTARCIVGTSKVNGRIYVVGGWGLARGRVTPMAIVEEFDTGFRAVNSTGQLTTTWGQIRDF